MSPLSSGNSAGAPGAARPDDPGGPARRAGTAEAHVEPLGPALSTTAEDLAVGPVKP
jgi:hypothetical protein